MIFEKISIKNFAIFTGKHLFWGLFLIKMQAFRPATFFKKRLQYRCFLWVLWNFKNIFLIENLRWLILAMQLQYSEVS